MTENEQLRAALEAARAHIASTEAYDRECDAQIVSTIDAALARPALIAPDDCAKTRHGTVRCLRCGQEWVDRVTLLPGSPLEKRHGQAC